MDRMGRVKAARYDSAAKGNDDRDVQAARIVKRGRKVGCKCLEDVARRKPAVQISDESKGCRGEGVA
eukprot:5065310-Karenia_brevis.AAC.1